MKFLSLILAASALVACHSESKPHGGAAHASTAPADGFFDLSSCAERPMTAEEFVKRCQAATAANFTYEQATAKLMQSKEVRFDGPARLSSGKLEHYLATQFARSGLACKPVGPANLRVFVVERGQ